MVKKDLTDVIKDLEMGRLSGPTCNHESSYKREAEGVLTQRKHRRRQCEDGGRDWSNATTEQGLPVTTRSQKKQGTDSLLEPPERVEPCQHLDFQGKLISDFWHPEL